MPYPTRLTVLPEQLIYYRDVLLKVCLLRSDVLGSVRRDCVDATAQTSHVPAPASPLQFLLQEEGTSLLCLLRGPCPERIPAVTSQDCTGPGVPLGASLRAGVCTAKLNGERATTGTFAVPSFVLLDAALFLETCKPKAYKMGGENWDILGFICGICGPVPQCFPG